MSFGSSPPVIRADWRRIPKQACKNECWVLASIAVIVHSLRCGACFVWVSTVRELERQDEGSAEVFSHFYAGLIGGAANANGIEELSWLAGCWSHNNAEAGSVEMWTAPAGGTLLGLSRTVKNAKTVAHEFMQIRLDAGFVFIARPSNQSEASFRAIRASTSEVVFENLEHDFPQRVMYRLTAPGLMMARIEGTRDGKVRGIDYPMTKIACAAPAAPRQATCLIDARPAFSQAIRVATSIKIVWSIRVTTKE